MWCVLLRPGMSCVRLFHFASCSFFFTSSRQFLSFPVHASQGTTCAILSYIPCRAPVKSFMPLLSWSQLRSRIRGLPHSPAIYTSCRWQFSELRPLRQYPDGDKYQSTDWETHDLPENWPVSKFQNFHYFLLTALVRSQIPPDLLIECLLPFFSSNNVNETICLILAESSTVIMHLPICTSKP